MRKLTKKQRHEFYKKALSNSFNKSIYGGTNISQGLCCVLINEYNKKYEAGLYHWSATELFPEFSYFFNNEYIYTNNHRVIVLQFCIEMTKPCN